MLGFSSKGKIMRSWSKPPKNGLFGDCPDLRLYDSRDGEVKIAAPQSVAHIYVCGITPYDATHIGHAATYLTYDLVVRAWIDEGKSVKYVQCNTDIDDPILERSSATGQDWQQLGSTQTNIFREDMETLRVVPPDHYVGAVESIPQVAEAVRTIIVGGNAYELGVSGSSAKMGEPVTPDSYDVYLDIAKDHLFGTWDSLSSEKKSENLVETENLIEEFAEHGGDPDRKGKRNPIDPVIWRAARVKEPIWQELTLSPGRPGWHIECAVIANKYLDGRVDVQGGGADLYFPHHAMTESHLRLLGDTEGFGLLSNVGMVYYQGEKMSKSLGNLVLVSQLRANGVDPGAIRLAIYANHYRQAWEWTDDNLELADKRLNLWKDAVSQGNGASAYPYVEFVRRAIANDLDTPKALEAIDEWSIHTLEGQGEDYQAGETISRIVDARFGIDINPVHFE